MKNERTTNAYIYKKNDLELEGSRMEEPYTGKIFKVICAKARQPG